MILERFGFRVTIGGQSGPTTDFVVRQVPSSGRVRAGSTVALNLGPGPHSGSQVYFAKGIVIPITHDGRYAWRSPSVCLNRRPSSIVLEPRAVGNLQIGTQDNAPVTLGNLTHVVVTFDAFHLHAPAWFLIMSIHAGFDGVSVASKVECRA